VPSFRGECPHCDKVTEHEEFYREKRAARSEQAANRGDYKTVHEWAFRCKTCGFRHEKILDEAGKLHKWNGNRHVVMDVGGA
jgi:hypothetical protein